MVEFSYSQISTWKQCPHRFFHHYIQQNKIDTSNINTLFGTAIHETLQLYLNILYNKSVKLADSWNINLFFKQRVLCIYKEIRLKLNRLFVMNLVLHSYFKTGLEILLYFKKHRLKYFRSTQCELLGTLLLLRYLIRPNVFFKGFIDVVIKDNKLDIIRIIDFKTSQRGWNDNDKKDLLKKSQLLLYKLMYSKQFNIDINLIQVLFIILKKQVMKYDEFNIPRIQVFLPSNKKPSIKKALILLELFLTNCVTNLGLYNNNSLLYEPAKLASVCKWCPYYHLNAILLSAMVCKKWDKKYKRKVIDDKHSVVNPVV